MSIRPIKKALAILVCFGLTAPSVSAGGLIPNRQSNLRPYPSSSVRYFSTTALSLPDLLLPPTPEGRGPKSELLQNIAKAVKPDPREPLKHWRLTQQLMTTTGLPEQTVIDRLSQKGSRILLDRGNPIQVRRILTILLTEFSDCLLGVRISNESHRVSSVEMVFKNPRDPKSAPLRSIVFRRRSKSDEWLLDDSVIAPLQTTGDMMNPVRFEQMLNSLVDKEHKLLWQELVPQKDPEAVIEETPAKPTTVVDYQALLDSLFASLPSLFEVSTDKVPFQRLPSGLYQLSEQGLIEIGRMGSFLSLFCSDKTSFLRTSIHFGPKGIVLQVHRDEEKGQKLIKQSIIPGQLRGIGVTTQGKVVWFVNNEAASVYAKIRSQFPHTTLIDLLPETMLHGTAIAAAISGPKAASTSPPAPVKGEKWSGPSAGRSAA